MHKQNTNNVNKTQALQQTGGQDESKIVFMRTSQHESHQNTGVNSCALEG